MPASGTVYAYSYISLDEVFAWLAGWSLILEYSVGASAVAAGWSGYFSELVGLLVYFGYSYHKSRLNSDKAPAQRHLKPH